MPRGVVMLFILTCGLALVQAQSQGPTFRATGESVPIFVTVTDKDQRLVTTLQRQDFQVFDNGKPQTLTVFDNTPQAVRLILLLDVSGSMAGNLPILRQASLQLFSRLRPDDQVRVGTFGREVLISEAFTNDPAALRAALPTEILPNSPTPLWKAVDQSIGTFRDEPGRRVVLVLSDGKDAPGPSLHWNEKFANQLDVTDRAQREDVMIYAVGLRSRPNRSGMPGGDIRQMMIEDLPDPGLGTAAETTGGGYFEIGPRDDLAAAFARVADELHGQYLMGFTPTQRDGKMHKIEVKLAAKDLKSRARRAYRAPK